MHEPSDIAIAALHLAGETIRALHQKGVLSQEEGLQIWRNAFEVNAAGGSSNKNGVAEVLKAAAPTGADL